MILISHLVSEEYLKERVCIENRPFSDWVKFLENSYTLEEIKKIYDTYRSI